MIPKKVIVYKILYRYEILTNDSKEVIVYKILFCNWKKIRAHCKQSNNHQVSKLNDTYIKKQFGLNPEYKYTNCGLNP